MFVLRMVWRETRASWARLLFFFLCVGLGVAAIVVLRSVVQHVRMTLAREAKSMVGADLVLQSSRPFTDAALARMASALSSVGTRTTTDVVETQTMASPLDGQGNGLVKLVELRGVEAEFPFYGAPELEGGQPYSHVLLAGHGVIVQSELLAALDVRVGESIRLAGQTFTIRGVLSRDRVQRSGGFALGPRVYLDLADLRTTTLLGFGSRASYQRLARTDNELRDATLDQLREALSPQFVSVRSWRRLEDRIGRSLTTAENYLSLVGFAVVVLGGIGVWSVTRVIVQQKIRSVAILKCIGASSRQVLATYVLQILLLATCGSLVGVGIAAVILASIPPALLQPLGVTVVPMTASAAVQGLTVGLLVSLLFALVPLLDVRRVKPLLLLRADATLETRPRDWQSWLVGGSIAVALTLVAVWQANSIQTGGFVSLGLGVVAAMLYGAARLLIRVTRPLAASSRFALRHAVVSLSRPGNQTRVILLAVGLGCFFIFSVRVLQANLLATFANEIGENSPDLVLIDVQRDQVDGLREAVASSLRQPARIVPLLRGRVAAVEGRRVQLKTPEDVRQQRGLGREFGLTFRAYLEPNETIRDGAFWTDASAAVPAGIDTEVSVEEDVSDESGVSLGDVMTFDIAGQTLRARVTSVRSVAWENSQNGGFVFVLRPGRWVDQVAHNYVGFLQVTDDASARGALQRRLVTAFPNVSIIDVRDVLAAVRDVVGNVSLGITVVGVVILVGGTLILIGAVAMTKFQRVYEVAIYRTLGASTRLVAAMIAIEYGILGVLAGSAGALGALGLSWGLARYLFDIVWHPSPGLLAGGVAAAAMLVGVVGLLASADILFRKPLTTLRGE